MKRHSILYFVAEDWYFCSHRMPLALAAQRSGLDVFVATNIGDQKSVIESSGFRVIPLNLKRRGKNPLREILVLAKLVTICLRVRPALVHNVSLKPVLYGTIAARICGVSGVVNTLPGLGHTFSARSKRARLLRQLVEMLFSVVLASRKVTLILQNPEDIELMSRLRGVSRSQLRLIRGSGVDTDQFANRPEQGSTPLVLFASRLLWSKGLGEFVMAAKTLRNCGVRARFVVVGREDDQNPSSIPVSKLREWDREGTIEWWGYRSDMPNVLSASHIVCLPTTYGEGVPKILIEAASCGRPIVATDVPGCREIVADGSNGFLVPANDDRALAIALRRLIEDRELRAQMGQKGRALACDSFSIQQVNNETLAIYAESLHQTMNHPHTS